jgi:predicted small secreted protein
MFIPRRQIAIAIGALSLALAGCQTDEAVEKDTKKGAKELKQGAKDVERGAEKAIDGDSDNDGR